MDQLAQHIESLIFTATSPISFKDVKGCLEESFDTKLKKPAIEKAIEQLKERYQQEDFSFELVEIAGGFQFLTKTSFHNTIGVYLKQTTKKRLSKAALETLSIIAYKQPVVKSEMEKIRGVSCDYSVQKLLEKELIAIVGRNDSPGQPLLYGTSAKFMDYFGLKSIEDLPKPKDFREPDQEIGEKAPIDEKITQPEEQVTTTSAADTPPTASSSEIVEDQPAATSSEQEDIAEPSLQNIPPSASFDESVPQDTVVKSIEDTAASEVEKVISPIVNEKDQEIENPTVLPTTTTEVVDILPIEEEAIVLEDVQAPEATSSETEVVSSPVVDKEDQETENPTVLPTTTTEVVDILPIEEEAIVLEKVEVPEDISSSEVEAVNSPIVSEEDQEIEKPTTVLPTMTEVAEFLPIEEDVTILEEEQKPTIITENESIEFPEEEISDDPTDT